MTTEEILRDSIHLFSVSDQAKVRELVEKAYAEGVASVPAAAAATEPEASPASLYGSGERPSKRAPRG